MFMAGLEIKLSSFRSYKKEITTIALINGGVPFLIGLLVGGMFDFSFIASIFLGIIFISSSVTIIIPSLQSYRILKEPVGKIIVGSSIIEEIASFTLFSILLQGFNTETLFPLPVFYLILALTVF